jgi:hypothetical protein
MLRGFVLCATLLVATDSSFDTKFVGYWYGENYQSSVRTYFQEFDTNRTDGTFEVEFREYLNCTLVERQIETGSWSIANGIVHQITQSINGKPVDATKDVTLIDDYQILVLDDHDYQSKDLRTGDVFKVWRLGRHFQFPNCDFTS